MPRQKTRRWLPLAQLAVTVIGAALGLFATAQSDQDPDGRVAKAVLQRADEVRFPAEGFEVGVAIRTFNAAEEIDARRYRVLSKGNENSIVMVTEPATERGQIMLMRGRDLWLFLPNVSQPVRLSLAQRLTGQVANGDIARANFTGDYDPKLLGVERIDNEDYYVLELTGVDRGVTYQRVKYWVRRSNFWPHKAEFYSLSGRLLKTCMYEEFKELGGKVRPTRLVMTDALRAGEQSLLEYSALRLRDLPDKIFTKDYLKKLE
jgi:outer membrane lipoprotein-sorting protein